jgi:hypothetical protein
VLNGLDPHAVSFENNVPTANPATNIKATEFTANWNSLSGATRYYLDVYTFDENSLKIYLDGFQARNVGNVTSFNISGLNHITEYFYVVRAGAEPALLSEFSNQISLKTEFSLEYFSPIASTATNIFGTSFRAHWETIPEATTYFLSVYTKGDGTEINLSPNYEFFDVGNVSSHIVSGLEQNTQYFYTLVASDGIFTSQVSNEITVAIGENGRSMSVVFIYDENIVIRSISSENLAVYNIAGQRLFSQNISAGETFLPKTNFYSGVYFVKVGNETHKILVR